MRHVVPHLPVLDGLELEVLFLLLLLEVLLEVLVVLFLEVLLGSPARGGCRSPPPRT